MRVVVVGATGHIGSYLVPALVGDGHEVVAVSRGLREPYRSDDAWRSVRRVTADRDAEDAAGTFAGRLVDLRADAIIDLMCFTPQSAQQLVDAFGADGPSCCTAERSGCTDRQSRCRSRGQRPTPFGEYGTAKAAIEELLLDATRSGGLRATCSTPGTSAGRDGRSSIPAANLDPEVWRALADAETINLPNFGLETLHHVHGSDVALAFSLALTRFDQAVGESFHVTSAAAVTLRGFAEAAAGWFGTRGPVVLPALGRLPHVGQAGARAGHLGAHLPQPLDEHREGASPARLRTPPHVAADRRRVVAVAGSARPGRRRPRPDPGRCLPLTRGSGCVNNSRTVNQHQHATFRSTDGERFPHLSHL